MKLLHTGDLHLDSAFCAYGQRDAEFQRAKSRELLTRIFELASSRACDIILVAGDLFDGRFVSPESAELFCSLVEKYKIPVALSPGNHDYYTEGGFYSKAASRLGELFILFSSNELQFFDIDELRTRVYGYAFTSPALTVSPLSEAELPNDNGYTKLLCAHADLASPISRYAPVTLGDIERFGFDYAALGHIHNRAPSEDVDGRVRYCGFAEGRSFDELGYGGVYVVELDDGECRCERVNLALQAFFESEVDVSACDGNETLRLLILNEAKRFDGSGVNLRITLTGRADDAVVRYAFASADDIASEAKIDRLELVDETLPYIDGEYLERDTTLRGELYRSLLPKLTGDDPEARRLAVRALRIGLAAIDGRNIFDAAAENGGRA